MGHMQASEMSEQVEAGAIDLDTALLWHLQSNHYPPIHPVFLEVAKEAIQLASAGEWDALLTLPNERCLTVAQVVDGLHLDSFLSYGILGQSASVDS